MIILLLLLVVFYVSHSWLAGSGVKEFASNRSRTFFRFYRFTYTLISSLFWGAISWWFIIKHEYDYLFTPSETLSAVGYLLAICGVALVAYSVLRYGAVEFTGMDAFMKPKQKTALPLLNTSGLNAVVRHPIYSGILLALAGLFLLLPTKMTLAAIVVSLIYLEVGIRLEEQKLEAEFGQAYRDYKQQVKKVIPFVY